MKPTGRLILILMLGALNATAEAIHPYYRVWRGVKLPSISREDFLSRLSGSFIPSLPAIMGPLGAVAYLPGVPPADKPAGLPDEVALVAYESEAAYRSALTTPEGKAYAASHWELFDRASTKSGPPVALAETIALDVPCDVLEKPVDWQAGYSTVFIGLKKDDVDVPAFLTTLRRHVVEIRDAFGPFGMDGYIFVTDGRYELAFQHWPDKTSALNAYQSSAAQDAFATARLIFAPTPVQFSEAVPFAGTIAPGQFMDVRIPARSPSR